MRNRISNVVWGLAFILVGIGMGGDIMGYWNFNLFFDGWWTLFIIIPSIVSIVDKGISFGNIVTLIIGGVLLLGAQDIIRTERIGDLIMPIILVLIGGSFVFKNGKHRRYYKKNIKTECNPYNTEQSGSYNSGDDTYTTGSNTYTNGNYEDILNLTGIFSGRKAVLINEVFHGGSLNAIFGGVELDLSNAIINHDVYIDATAIFGGIELFVPRDVKIVVSATPIFGGVSNKVPQPLGNTRGTIFINGMCMFGGVDIR
jgi:Predicted membrane protein (DUF2154).